MWDYLNVQQAYNVQYWDSFSPYIIHAHVQIHVESIGLAQVYPIIASVRDTPFPFPFPSLHGLIMLLVIAPQLV